MLTLVGLLAVPWPLRSPHVLEATSSSSWSPHTVDCTLTLIVEDDDHGGKTILFCTSDDGTIYDLEDNELIVRRRISIRRALGCGCVATAIP